MKIGVFEFFVGAMGLLALVGFGLYRCLVAWYFLLGGGAPVKSQRRW